MKYILSKYAIWSIVCVASCHHVIMSGIIQAVIPTFSIQKNVQFVTVRIKIQVNLIRNQKVFESKSEYLRFGKSDREKGTGYEDLEGTAGLLRMMKKFGATET